MPTPMTCCALSCMQRVFRRCKRLKVSRPTTLPTCCAEPVGEVKTSVIGVLHGWQFKRAWYYWVASGPGIEVEAAERLHATHGQSVRVDGHCGCPSPREWFKGLACGSYHVDDAEGLRALADCIKTLVQPVEGEGK